MRPWAIDRWRLKLLFPRSPHGEKTPPKLTLDMDHSIGRVYITKLKLTNRQKHGRAKLDLLQARVVTAAQLDELSSNLRLSLVSMLIDTLTCIRQYHILT